MITADSLEPPAGDPGQALDDMGRAVAPLMAEAWKRNGAFYGGRAFSLNAAALAQLWLSGDLKLFVAYETDGNGAQEPVGYLTGLAFRPLQCEGRMFQITDWWGRTKEAERVLFKAALDAMKFLGVSEAVATLRAGESLPELPPRWRETGRQEQVRFVKE